MAHTYLCDVTRVIDTEVEVKVMTSVHVDVVQNLNCSHTRRYYLMQVDRRRRQVTSGHGLSFDYLIAGVVGMDDM